MAHSMGGLVAQIYVKELDQGRKVRRVINMAVPFLGSANTFGTLTDGWGKGANLIAGGMTTIRVQVWDTAPSRLGTPVVFDDFTLQRPRRDGETLRSGAQVVTS